MTLVLIIGPGAVGKMTVGQELSKITGFPLMYNHLTIEPVREIFGDKLPWHLIMQIRELILEEFLCTDKDGIILTTMIDFNSPAELKWVDEWVKKFDNYLIVELYAPLTARLRRNITPNRLQYKPSKRDLEASMQHLKKEEMYYRLTSEATDKLWSNYMKDNNTNISAVEVARMIKDNLIE